MALAGLPWGMSYQPLTISDRMNHSITYYAYELLIG